MSNTAQPYRPSQPSPDKLAVLSLFSGIGGIDLGLEMTGHFYTVGFCEIEDYPRKMPRKHPPKPEQAALFV